MSISRNHVRTSTTTTTSLSPQPHQNNNNNFSPSSSSRRRQASIATSSTDPQTLHILKKFGLDDVMPKPQDFDSARADLLPADGSTPIFAGGRPIHRRRESSSPAVTEALARGFKLTHYPARALLPEDQFSHHGKNSLQQQQFFEDENGDQQQQKRAASASASTSHHSRVSPDPRITNSTNHQHHHLNLAEQQQRQQKTLAEQLRHQSNNRSVSSGQNNNNSSPYANAARIPANIDPHVLPQGALMQPLPPARELLETNIPLQQTTRYDESNEQWLGGFDAGDWALSDPIALTSMARIYRRCFPRTEKDDQHDDFPTSDFAGNYILRRYGGCFPSHCHYSFYRRYGEYGCGAASSEYHNFPAGRHPLGPI